MNRSVLCGWLGALFAVSLMAAAPVAPSCAQFEARAKAGDHLTVIFFGASLTWGANASDQNYTSYRAYVAARMEAAYPNAHITFRDAAIGGTGSQLGVFRLQRDVLDHKPDLVFLDFSANDDIYSADAETLASYESLVRRMVLAKVPVVQVIFPFKWNISDKSMDGMKRRTAHSAISQAYHTGLGDAIALIRDRVAANPELIKELWPFDGVHPGDQGYALFAEAAWDGYEQAVADQRVCVAPEKMLNPDTYMTWARVRLSQLGPVPAGWEVTHPILTAAWHDAYMARWLDDVTVASSTAKVPVAPFMCRFTGEMVFLFGQKSLASCTYKVLIDGKLAVHHEGKGSKRHAVETFDASSKQFGGNTHLSQVVATGLEPGTHFLEIVPLFAPGEKQELRLESICVAGKDASVIPVAQPQP